MLNNEESAVTMLTPRSRPRLIRNRLTAAWIIMLGLTLGMVGSTGEAKAQQAAHTGTDFWLAIPNNYYVNKFEIYIQSDQAATFTVTIANPAFTFVGTVAPGAPKTVTLPSQAEIVSSQVVENKGIHVRSDYPISVVLRTPSDLVNNNTTEDSYLGLPTSTLGQEYITIGYQESISTRFPTFLFLPSQLVVLATTNATTVTFTPSCTSVHGTPAGQPFSITLNQGQVYQYQCTNKQDVTGTVIGADQPIAVFGGNMCADIPAGTAACDYLVEEMFPVSMWGKDYYTFPLNDRTDDLHRFIAAADGTTITVEDGNQTQTIRLNRAQYVDLTTGRALHIQADKSIAVAQYARGALASPAFSYRDPLEMLVVPTDLYLTHVRTFTPTWAGLNAFFQSFHFLNIITPTQAAGSVRLDGSPVSGFSALPGGAYQGVSVAVTPGEHLVTADAPVAVYTYGYNYFTSYGYPAGLALPAAFQSVRLIDTVSKANIDLDQTTFSKTPVSVTPDPVNNTTVIEWQFPTFDIGQIEDLSFDVVLKNPVPGEDRLVHHKLELLYNDINGNPVRTEIGERFVHVQTSAFTTAVTTDKAQYGANEDVLNTLSIANLSDHARTITAAVEIQDAAGNFVGPVATLSGVVFNPGEAKTFPGLVYNTGTILAGNYRVVAGLFDAGAAVGSAQAPFANVAVPQLAATVVPDKTQYAANETVILTSTVTNGTMNAGLTGLSAAVTVLDPNGVTVFAEARSLSDLLPSSGTSFKSFWAVQASVPGNYAAVVTVTTSNGPTATSSAGFSIASSLDQAKALAGTITVTPNGIIEGETTQLSYTVQNIGNVLDVPQVTLEILIVNPDTGVVMRTLTDFASLNAREVFANGMTFESAGLAPANYLSILRGIIGEVTQTLDSAPLTISPIPNTAPHASAGPDQVGIAGQPVQLDGTGSFDPENDPITYTWAFVSVPQGSAITTTSLIGANIATPSFVPDAAGSYILSLVVKDGQFDSQTDQVAVHVSPPIQIDLHPETINLKSNGASTSVTVVLFSPLLESFALLMAPDGTTVTATFSFTHVYTDKGGNAVSFTTPTTDYPGDDFVQAMDLDGDGAIDGYQVTLKIDRQLIINGFTDSTGALRITQPTALTSTVFGNGLQIGSDINTVIAPPEVTKGGK